MLLASVIGIVRDARGFVDGYLITLHDPFKRWLAVDDAVVGLQQNARKHLLEVRGKAAAVFRGMQDAVSLIAMWALLTALQSSFEIPSVICCGSTRIAMLTLNDVARDPFPEFLLIFLV